MEKNGVNRNDQFKVEHDGNLVEASEVKICSCSADSSISWAGQGLNAIKTM